MESPEMPTCQRVRSMVGPCSTLRRRARFGFHLNFTLKNVKQSRFSVCFGAEIGFEKYCFCVFAHCFCCGACNPACVFFGVVLQCLAIHRL